MEVRRTCLVDVDTEPHVDVGEVVDKGPAADVVAGSQSFRRLLEGIDTGTENWKA